MLDLANAKSYYASGFQASLFELIALLIKTRGFFRTLKPIEVTKVEDRWGFRTLEAPIE